MLQLQKKIQGTWEEYKDTVRVCRDVTRRAKAHLVLNMARDVKDNNKVIRSNQHGFMEGRSRLISLIAFSDDWQYG